MLEQKILTVSDVTQYIREKLETDLRLSNIWVRGEISNCKIHTSGHVYFTLKDDSSSLRCVMFRSKSSKLLFLPENGMEVVARGYISVYDRLGQHQLYVEELDPSGVGSLYLAFEQLKTRLQEEGLFKPERKRPLPILPARLAIVTSPTGAALQDVLHVLNRRFPGLKIIIIPTLVQGDGAVDSICQALDRVNRYGHADVLLLVRGGGSIEDLWAFNTEPVARAVAAANIPVITGIGHETDFTIADFAADKRAPTPSAAAEMAVPVKHEICTLIDKLERRNTTAVVKLLNEKGLALRRLQSSRVFKRPDLLLNQYRQQLDLLEKGLHSSALSCLKNSNQRLESVSGKLNALSPLRILSRGYSICRKDGTVIRTAADVCEGEDIEVVLRKGSLLCSVCKTRGDLAWKKK